MCSAHVCIVSILIAFCISRWGVSTMTADGTLCDILFHSLRSICLLQYCILDDTATQRRTAFAAFQYDSGIWWV